MCSFRCNRLAVLFTIFAVPQFVGVLRDAAISLLLPHRRWSHSVGPSVEATNLEAAIEAGERACRLHLKTSLPRVEIWRGTNKLYASPVILGSQVASGHVRTVEARASGTADMNGVLPINGFRLDASWKLSMLRRHSMTDHAPAAEQYRQRWRKPYSHPGRVAYSWRCAAMTDQRFLMGFPLPLPDVL